MKRSVMFSFVLAIILMFCMSGISLHGKAGGEFLEYEVVDIAPQTWIVTAKEVDSGKLIKFRLPPSVFLRQTFAADISKAIPGRRFVVRARKNARLDRVIMNTPIKAMKSTERKNLVKKNRRFRQVGSPGPILPWQILHVDSSKWVVKAKNTKNGQIIRFKVDAKCFKGYRFYASTQGIRQGQGFSMVAPNNAEFSACCTLLK